MYYILKYNLQKSEGGFPNAADVSAKFPNKDCEQVLKESMKFSFNNDNGLLPVVDWKMVDEGLASFQISNGDIEGYPQPVIWLHLEDEVDMDDNDAWADALSSDYVLSIEGINEDSPFYFQDHNGYSKVESAEWLADEIWESLQETIANMEDDQSDDLSEDVEITRRKSHDDEGIALSAIIKNDDKEFVFSWFFESEDAISDFEYYNNEYSDSDGCAYAEGNAMIYRIHRLICQGNE
jgi:hypothetical protein